MKIVQEILVVVDTLHIEPHSLESDGKRLVRTVKAYSKNRANMPQVVDLAKRILDKWSRMVFGISTSYFQATTGDGEGDQMQMSGNDDQYRNMRMRIE